MEDKIIKTKEVRARVTDKLKKDFTEKLHKDGITESDFIVSCIMSYLGIETVPKKLKDKREE